MKRIIANILFIINLICLATSIYLNFNEIAEDYNINSVEAAPYFWVLAAVVTIIVYCTIYFKQKISLAVSIILLAVLLLLGYLFIEWSPNKSYSGYTYEGSVLISNRNPSDQYSIALMDLTNVFLDNELDFPVIINKKSNIDCYDTIRNCGYKINTEYNSNCGIDIKDIKHLDDIPVRIYKNDTLFLDTVLAIKPDYVNYKNQDIVIRFDKLIIKKKH